MFLDKPQKLTYLIWLGLTAFGLEVEHLRQIGMDEDMVAAMHAVQPESKALDKVYHITELNVSHCAPREAHEQLPAVHGRPTFIS